MIASPGCVKGWHRQLLGSDRKDGLLKCMTSKWIDIRKALAARGLLPRLMSREEAAHYVHLSPTAFDIEVAAGTFPPPFRLRVVRRRLWDVRAIDAAIDRMGEISDMHERKRAWEEWHAEREARQEERFRVTREKRAAVRTRRLATK
jgi:predicted DNA-binding transcriptional regulator AlpA